MSSADQRLHPRFRVALRAHLALPTGTVSTATTGVSRTGMSVRLSPAPALEENIAITLELPNGTSIDGRA
ncbi:MAG TPA: PilZ domain-containing protein, partial [Myxococcota bacterium]